MVKAPLVVPDRSFAEEILAVLDRAKFEVDVAVWVKEHDRWTLIIGTPRYDSAGPSKAYLDLIKALSAEGSIALSDYPIRLEGSRNTLIRALRKRYRKTRAVDGVSIAGGFPGLWIEDGYLMRLR